MALCYVITGGPCSGKTTTIKYLKNLGYNTTFEFGSQLIKEGVLHPAIDRNAFQTEIFKRRLILENDLKKTDKTYFLERGFPDGEAYYKIDNLEPPSYFNDLDLSHYKKVFLLEELPFFENDGVRWENIEFSKKLNVLLEQCYLKHNLSVIKIGYDTVANRVNQIIHQINKAHAN